MFDGNKSQHHLSTILKTIWIESYLPALTLVNNNSELTALFLNEEMGIITNSINLSDETGVDFFLLVFSTLLFDPNQLYSDI